MNKKPLTINTFTKSYGSLIAVDQLSLEINSGEVFGFLGPNGAGKSTTIRTMMNFIAPSAGEIKIFGLDSVLLIFGKSLGWFMYDGEVSPIIL